MALRWLLILFLLSSCAASQNPAKVPLPKRPQPPPNYGLSEVKNGETSHIEAGEETYEYLVDLERYITILQKAPCFDSDGD